MAAAPARANGRRADDTERAKEREFYRYYHQSQRPKFEQSAATPIVEFQGPLLPSPLPSQPSPSEDKALTAFAQLGALRLNARRCLISFFDRKNGYILAEATRTLSLQTGQAQLEEDNLCWGTSVFPKRSSICYSTVNLASKSSHDAPDQLPTLVVNDLASDDRFKDLPLVAGPPYSRFYAGVPIRSPSGHSIGTYCVFDDSPRDGISVVEMAFLQDMAITVMRHLQMARATDDQRRGGLMVQSLGAFADGKASEEWLQDWENGGSSAPQTRPGSRHHRQRTLSKGLASQRPVIVARVDSTDSVALSTLASNPISPISGASTFTPASEIVPDPSPDDDTPTQTVSSATKKQNRGNSSAQIKALFARAAVAIGEATEADDVVFFDAKISTFGGLVDDEIPQDQQSEAIDKPSAVLGASSVNTSKQNPLSEGMLRHLLKSYPHGQVFNLDEDTSAPTHPVFDAIPAEIQAEFLESTGLKPLTSPTSEVPRCQDDENLLKEAFPEARSLVLYPLLDAHRDRYYAGGIVWSSDPMRVFTSEQELSYLAAFSNSIMAEVARLDTKLADAAKGDFISSISHELRSPLHGILGSCELLQDTAIDSFQRSMAQTIETCGKTLLDTINHVLDFAKINSLTRGNSKRVKKRSRSTKQAISPSQSHSNDMLTLSHDTDLCLLAEEVLETVFSGYKFQRSATQNIETSPATPQVPPIAVIVDVNRSDNYCFQTQPGAWRRILMNLFGNALKYTPAGYIRVKLQATPVKDSPEGLSEVRLTITDSGIGMSEDYINTRLFHSFAQENPLSQGTGLGLSIVKQIVESLGGEIEATSKQGFGTKFTVCCPLKPTMMSPSGGLSAMTGRDLHAVRKRTEGMKVTFVGFDDENEYFPVKSLKNKNATMLSLKALDTLCTDWFGMVVQQANAASGADLFVATEAGAKWLRTQSSAQAKSALSAPVIVVCQGAASAQMTTAITVPGQLFECIPQPCGPHKLAKALTSCLDRHVNRLMAHTQTTEMLEEKVEPLDLKENVAPARLEPLQPAFQLTLPIKSPVDEALRPRIATALSAPEIGTVKSPPTTPSDYIHGRPLHCLAVDDNPINLRLLRTFVEKLNHTHGSASNGLEALSAFKSRSKDLSSPFDVVLMDINMPEMDGLEATRQIRAYERDNGLKPTTIIALTGVASSEAQQEAHVSGVNLFMIKPVRLAELETVLKGVVVGNDTAKNEASGSSTETEQADGQTQMRCNVADATPEVKVQLLTEEGLKDCAMSQEALPTTGADSSTKAA